MTGPGKLARSVGGVLLVAAVLSAAVVAVVSLRVSGNGDEAGGSAGSAPATGPAAGSQPAATRPAAGWRAPVFTGRKSERAALVRTLRACGVTDKAVLKAMGAVGRDEFVAKSLSRAAYANRPLPIGYGQTISQPLVVAEMTRELRLTSGSRVLEIGTGSGYQAAVLAEFTPHVWTIEIIKPLAVAAAERLKRLGYDVIRTRCGDGYYGWAEAGPFDGIIVTCAAGRVPPPLIKQLKPGGRMVIPVGQPYAVQHLMLIEKRADGTVRSRVLMAVRFVPLLRKDRSAR